MKSKELLALATKNEARSETVEWETPDGEKVKFSIGVKPVTISGALKLGLHTNDPEAVLHVLCACVLLGDDQVPLEMQDAENLSPSFAAELLSAVTRALGLDEEKKT